MIRRSVIFVSVLALLVSSVAIALWVRSRRRADAVSWVYRKDRYTLRSVDGRIALFAPPGPAAQAKPKVPWELTEAGMRPDQILWVMVRDWPNFPDLRPGRVSIIVPLIDGSFTFDRARALFGLSDAQLLRDLDGPSTFVAAHLILAGRTPYDGRLEVRAEYPDNSCAVVLDDLQVTAASEGQGV